MQVCAASGDRTRRCRRMTDPGAAVMTDRAARARLLVAAARAAAAAGRHARTTCARGQRALAHQRAGEALTLPVTRHDQEYGYGQ